MIDYLRWVEKDLSPTVKEQWAITSWVIRYASRCRSIELHTYRQMDVPDHRYTDTIIDCNNCDARSNDYHMSDVTGMDFRVLQCLIGQSNVAKFIQDVVLKIEAFELTRVTFTCDGGTHRSVGVCNLLILFVSKRNFSSTYKKDA